MRTRPGTVRKPRQFLLFFLAFQRKTKQALYSAPLIVDAVASARYGCTMARVAKVLARGPILETSEKTTQKNS